MRLITSESVSCGHPDKIADQISDAILDAYLRLDPNAKVAVETMVKDNCVVLGGEITSTHTINYENVIKTVIEDIGYHNANYGFYFNNVTIINLIGKQSPEINSAVLQNGEESLGAGDQGFMTGFATNETETYMPIGMYVAKKLADYVYSLHLGPDIKTQVTIEEWPDLKRIHTILVSTMHKEFTLDELRRNLTNYIKKNLMGLQDDIFALIDKETKIVINPAGSWYVGGPVADCGVTGRKIVVDQYGPYNPVGGGAFSGKDPSKVDRSGAYLARYIAKNIVAAGFADKCAVEIAYMIGVAKPASLNINTFGQYSDELLEDIVSNIFPMTPSSIINQLNLKQPIYFEASRGHFGNDTMPWEKLDKVEQLKKLLNPLDKLIEVKPLVEDYNVEDDEDEEYDEEYDDEYDEEYDDEDEYDEEYDEEYDDEYDEEMENLLKSIKIDCNQFSISDFIEKYGIMDASKILKVLENNGCVAPKKSKYS